MIRLIHHLPTPIIHSLLLQLKLSVALPNCHTVGYRTVLLLTLPRMDLEKSPDAFTNITSSIRLNLAPSTVLEKSLHLGTVGRCTLGGSTRRGMQEQGHVQSNATLTLLPLFGC